MERAGKISFAQELQPRRPQQLPELPGSALGGGVTEEGSPRSGTGQRYSSGAASDASICHLLPFRRVCKELLATPSLRFASAAPCEY